MKGKALNMKFVIFSDVHGNFEMLKTMLEKTNINLVDGYIFCGDIVGYSSEQEKITNFLSDNMQDW